MKLITKCFLCGALALAAGCSFSNPNAVLPDEIRTVKINAFSNKTVLYGLEDKLFQKLHDALMEDGRLIPAQENADALLIGDITRYELIPLSFDANGVVEEYKLWIESDFRFVEADTSKVLCEENSIPIDVRFHPPGSTRPGAVIETEQNAQERAVDELVSEIVYLLLRNK
jgi:outer membrane lipopolysaccharide assembly protein LptE/RlpB